MDGSTSYMHHLRCLFAFSDVSHSGDKNETLDITWINLNSHSSYLTTAQGMNNDFESSRLRITV